jgi:sugar lactone lactonase YvrE
MGEARHFGNPEGLEFLLSGAVTGQLVTWSAAKGWERLAGSRAAFPNGIVASPDGRTLWFAAWTGREVLRYDRETGAVTGRVSLDFLPDNLAFAVSEIDPATMTARTTASGKAGQLGGASVAVRVGEVLYVGAFSGDRVLRIEPAPR